MKKSIMLAFISTFVVLFAFDFIWHSLVFMSFYNSAFHGIAHLSSAGLLAPNPVFLLLGDLVFSVMYVYFIPQMGSTDNSVSTLAMRGGLLGLIAIIHFPLTGYAIVNGFPVMVILVDGIYGLVSGTLVSFVIGYFFRKAVGKTTLA